MRHPDFAAMKHGQIIGGRYELRGVLGRGGMGEVYLAYDHRLATDVALKRVPLELSLEPQIREALVREGRILARLSDSHIVRLFDLAETVEGIFLVLEFVCGPSLDKVLAQRKTLSIDELHHVLGHITLGLTRAHSLGIMHRDLKPSNLLVALTGEEQQSYLRHGTLPLALLSAEIKVTDFGLAKVIEANAEASRQISGTPGFMAPEQFRGELPSPETDIYALGLIAYICLAGKSPIGDLEPVYFHMNITPPPIEGVPHHINAAIQKAIHKQREKRFKSVAQFNAALLTPPQPVRPEPFTARPADMSPTPPKVYDPGSRKNRSRVWISLAVLPGLILAGFLTGAFSSRKPVSEAKTAAAAIPEEAAALPPLPPLNPAPRIDEPPPAIASSQSAQTSIPLPEGINQPQILGRLRVTGARVFGFGPDSTLYVTSDRSDIGAIRNGRLLWQYRLGGDDGQFSIASNGLIWIRSRQGMQRLFCFNAAGQGGEFVDPTATQRYLSFASREQKPPNFPRCVDPDGKHRDPGLEVAGAWRTPLDHRCEKDPVVAPDGSILVQTQSKTMYLMSAQGHPQWTYPAPCVLDAPLLLSSGVAVGLCGDRKHLIGVREGRQAFLIKSDETLSSPVAQDSGGSFYRFADTNVYDRKLLIKTNSAGKDTWTLPLRLPLSPEVAMSPDGTLYLLHPSPEGSYAILIGDRLR